MSHMDNFSGSYFYVPVEAWQPEFTSNFKLLSKRAAWICSFSLCVPQKKEINIYFRKWHEG